MFSYFKQLRVVALEYSQLHEKAFNMVVCFGTLIIIA